MRRVEFIYGAFAAAAADRSAGGGTLRLDAVPLGSDVNPYRDAERGVDELSWLYGDGLVGWRGELVPAIAAALPERSRDGLRYRYKLRTLTWHDGKPVTANDVRAAFRVIARTPWATYEPYRSVVDLRVVDDRTFAVHLNSPRPDFVRTFFGPYGVPALPLLRTAPATVPIGTGPFRILRRHDGEYRWALERWPFSPRGAPHLSGIDLRIITSETTANVQLASGEADIALPLFSDPIEPSRFVAYPRLTSTAVILFNAEGAFADVDTRRAFAAAVDVPNLQRAYDRHRTTLLASLLLSGPNDPGFERSLAYRPEAASTLRAKLSGRTITLVYVARSASHERLAALLYDKVNSIGRIGIDLEQRSGVLYQSAVGTLAQGRFDIAVWRFAYGPQADLAADWSCRNRPPHGGNFSRWCDGKLERVIESAPEAALRRLYETMACIPLSRAHENIGVGRRVRGFSLMPDLVPQTYGCADWSLDMPT